MKPLKTNFVVADGSRARWVKRSERADDFVTVRELTATRQYAGPPEGVVFSPASGARFTVEERDAAARSRRSRFAEEIASTINADAAAGGFDRLAMIAPARMLSAIRCRLSPAASARLVRTLPKDLTKVPDHDLRTWLGPLER